MTTVMIQVSGPEHAGKTSIIVAIERLLRKYGADVVVQRIDPQLEDKERKSDGELAKRIKECSVLVMEMQTH